MFRKKYAKRTAAIILSVLTMLGLSTTVYGFEGGVYHDFRDGDISIYLPEEWVSEEIGADEDGVDAYERIAEAWDEGDTGLSLGIYYMSEDVQNDYFYLDNDEEAALTYYENYGGAAVDELYNAGLAWPLKGADQSKWQLSEPVFFDGQWNGFLMVTGSGTTEQSLGERMDFQHTIYLTVRMTDDSESMVHNMLVFYNDENTALTEQQAQLAKEIADEFYDYDYYNVMAGIETDESPWGSGLDMGSGDEMDVIMTLIIGIVSILAPLGIIVGVIVIIAKRAADRAGNSRRSRDKGARSFSAGFTGIQQSLDLGSAINKFKKRQAEKNSFSGKEQRAEKRTEWKAERRTAMREERRAGVRTERRSTMQMRTREAESAEQRYYESLQTLHKTGLLTKDEMRDMLERHERSRARQRSR